MLKKECLTLPPSINKIVMLCGSGGSVVHASHAHTLPTLTHTTPHHTTPHHITPHHTTPHHSTPHHTLSLFLSLSHTHARTHTHTTRTPHALLSETVFRHVQHRACPAVSPAVPADGLPLLEHPCGKHKPDLLSCWRLPQEKVLPVVLGTGSDGHVH